MTKRQKMEEMADMGGIEEMEKYFVKIGSTKIDCFIEDLHKPFNNLYCEPNHLNKLVHGCISESLLIKEIDGEETWEEKCIECQLSVFLRYKQQCEEGKELHCDTAYSWEKFETNNVDPRLFAHCSDCLHEKKQKFDYTVRLLLQEFFTKADFGPNLKCYLRKLIPKNTKKYKPMYEYLALGITKTYIRFVAIPICLDGENSSGSFFPHKSYAFRYEDGGKELDVYVHKDFHLDAPSCSLVASKTWLIESVLPKLKKWAEASKNHPHHSYKFDSLIDIGRYSVLYFELKEKYGPYFVSIWPENTDPLKFVYEDIAIATYLLLIWEEDREKKGLSQKQSFVDLGCGNGLLVYILTKEGHPGKGIDIVKRKIWDLYEDIVLEESTIIPHTLKVDVDWIVGNHTDELTPWIPVIAARSSYSVNYFVLPCCFYNFDRKFDNGAACTQSKYRNYLDFIVDIGDRLGFQVEEDILKIPSTKRICSIGRTRKYAEEEHQHIDEIIEGILKHYSCSIELDKASVEDSFTPRKVTKDPKNCTQLDPHVKEKIIDSLIDRLLQKTNIVNCTDDDKLTSSGHKWSEWNAGDCISIPECADLFNKELLKSLKEQSGGLQSLLRNYQRIFKIHKGKVALRDFRNSEERNWGKKGTVSRKADNIKTTGCWFFTSHPQGCVLSAEDCCFAHGENDLKSYHKKDVYF